MPFKEPPVGKVHGLEKLSEEKQELLTEVFNSCFEKLEEDENESKCYAIAWKEVKKTASLPKKYQHINFVPPKTAQEAAIKALKWKEEYPDEVDNGTPVGWKRARQLREGKALSPDIVRRMAAFKRHQKNKTIAEEYKGTPWKDRGYMSWLIWGGDSGVEWAIRTVDKMNKADESIKKASKMKTLIARMAMVKTLIAAFPKDSLHYYVEKGDLSAVKERIKRYDSGHYVKPKTRKNMTKKVVKHSDQYIGTTPLHIAVLSGHNDILKELLSNPGLKNVKNENGIKMVDVNLEDESGNTPLLDAVLKLFSDTQSGDWSGVSKAEEAIQLLVGNGANVNKSDRSGKTPLDYIIEADHAGMFEFLFTKGATSKKSKIEPDSGIQKHISESRGKEEQKQKDLIKKTETRRPSSFSKKRNDRRDTGKRQVDHDRKFEDFLAKETGRVSTNSFNMLEVLAGRRLTAGYNEEVLDVIDEGIAEAIFQAYVAWTEKFSKEVDLEQLRKDVDQLVKRSMEFFDTVS